MYDNNGESTLKSSSKKIGVQNTHRGPSFHTQDLVHSRFTTRPQVGN